MNGFGARALRFVQGDTKSISVGEVARDDAEGGAGGLVNAEGGNRSREGDDLTEQLLPGCRDDESVEREVPAGGEDGHEKSEILLRTDSQNSELQSNTPLLHIDSNPAAEQ